MAYINKENFIAFIDKKIDKNRLGYVIGSQLKDYINKQPTADVVEVKHGEWAVNVGMNFNKERICPICKKKIEGNYWNYCSNCGAKMDGSVARERKI